MTPSAGNEAKDTQAKDIMSAPAITISSDKLVSDAAKLMLDRNIGAVIVVDAAGNYLGMLTERDYLPREALIPFMRGGLFRVMGKQVGDAGDLKDAVEINQKRRIAEVMDTEAPVAKPETPASELAEKMMEGEVNHVPVVDGDRPIGMVSRHDFLRMFSPKSS